MFGFTVALVACHQARAGEGMNVGLFLNAPDLLSEDSSQSVNFSANINHQTYDLGLSTRIGSVVLGFESRKANSLTGGGGSSLSVGSSGFSGSSTVIGDSSHRFYLGTVLPNKSVVYGFNGVTNRKSQYSMSYSNSNTVSEVRQETQYKTETAYRTETSYREETRYRDEQVTYGKWVGCPRVYVTYTETVSVPYTELVPYTEQVAYTEEVSYSVDNTYTANVTASGSEQFSLTDMGLVVGAGFEQHMLGGMLRFEYSFTHFNGFSKPVEVARLSSDESVVSSGQAQEVVHWDEVQEHLVQMRWQASF